ncbi:MAG TPA: polyketide synthase, partial [Polyangiaceae bacterium]|nr:polyketide synthase [Polyangiaceae bacterium]
MGSPRDHESTPEPIAVVGMACRFPDAGDPRAFWANLIAGKVSTGEVPAGRWDWRARRSGAGSEGDAAGGRWGSFVDGVDLFDAEFFGVSPKEAELMDPQQRVMLEVCWSCLEHAGVTPAGLPGRNVGVYVAVFNHDYKEILEREPRAILAHHATGCSASIVANRVSHYFDFSGPSLTVDTACSGSLYALHQAVLALRAGECDAALAGGVNLLLTPTRHASFAKTGMLSPTGRCHSFDERADGYVRGEGAGVVLLMPLGKALRGGHRVHGLVKGSAVNHGGKAFTLTYPSSRAQADVIYRAWSGAGLHADDIDYIEAHGTGTPKGDPIEWEGLNDAFARLSGPGRPRAPRRPRALGTVKASIGHLEAAAGVAGLIKVLLAFEHDRLP